MISLNALAAQLVQAAPIVIETVDAIETAIPATGQGAVKKAVAMACFQHLPDLIAGISAMIDGIVAAKKGAVKQ